MSRVRVQNNDDSLKKQIQLNEALDRYSERFGTGFCVGGFGHKEYTPDEAIACIEKCLETGIPEDQTVHYNPEYDY